MCLIHIMKETVVKKQKKQVENKLVIELRTKFKTAEDNDYEKSPEESAGPVLTDKWIANSIFVPDDPLNAVGCREGGKNSVTLRSFFERYKQIDDGTQGDGAGRTVTLTLDETTVEFRLTGCRQRHGTTLRTSLNKYFAESRIFGGNYTRIDITPRCEKMLNTTCSRCASLTPARFVQSN